MPLIYRRFTEKAAEEWRQIYKSLQLLEFLIKHGSERVIDDARGHITLLKMLRQFHFIDDNGKDQGINVRNRAKELADLLGDVERIRTERKKARATKNKYTGVEGGMSLGGGFSGGSGRYGGFGSESAGYGANPTNFGGFSGGVYGDGGGFGGQEDFRESSTSRSDRFEEYDEFDEGDRPTPSRSTRRSDRSAGKRAAEEEPPKPKQPEVDLFSFDEPEQSASAAPAASNGTNMAALGSAPVAAKDDDDEFDDFQSATPAAERPTLTSTASSAQFAAPQPLSAPQRADLSQMVSNSSISPAPAGSNYSAFAAPAPTQTQTQTQVQPPKPTSFQPSGPNYFGGVQAQSTPTPMAAAPAPAQSGPTTMANAKPVTSAGAKAPGAAGGDAFGALWGKASAGIKKTDTSTSAPAMGQLAKEKSSAGIWGANAASQPSKPSGGQASGGSALDDLLG